MAKAILLCHAPIKAGRLIPVYNKVRKANAKKSYLAVWVEDAKGNNEECLLFTEKEILRAKHRAEMNPEDLTEKHWFTDIFD